MTNETPVFSGQVEWVLDPAALSEELARTGLREELIPPLLEAAREAKKLPDVHDLLRQILDATLEGARPDPHVPGHPLLPALAVFAGYPQARERYERLGIPQAVTDATLRDIERSIDTYRDTHGFWGFGNVQWLHRHLTADLFEIGRLQYHFGTMGLPYWVYRDKTGGGLACLAKDGLACTPDGWPRKEADGFVTALRHDEEFAEGHPVLADSGRVSSRTAKLSLAQYELVANPGSTILFIHIPRGDKLTPEACGQSLERAALFFDRHFPETVWNGYGCVTWLLDRELNKILPPDSNVLAFARRFFPLALPNATGAQIVDRVLGRGKDPATFIPRSSLQKAVVNHLKTGGSFHTTGGFIARK